MDNTLVQQIHRLHTTALGEVRIKRNLGLDTDDVVEWCKSRILASEASIKRNGKNWYVNIGDSIITINANSFTIITAHKCNKLNCI